MAIAKDLTLTDFQPDNGNNSDSRKLTKVNEIIDAVNTLDGGDLVAASVTAAKALIFISAEQTGTGAPQNVAHGLGAAPSVVLVAPTSLAAGLASGYDCVEGAHTGTNVALTVTNGAKFKVFAWA